MYDYSFPACAFYIFSKRRLVRAHSFHSFGQDQSTVAQRAETTVSECSLTIKASAAAAIHVGSVYFAASASVRHYCFSAVVLYCYRYHSSTPSTILLQLLLLLLLLLLRLLLLLLLLPLLLPLRSAAAAATATTTTTAACEIVIENCFSPT